MTLDLVVRLGAPAAYAGAAATLVAGLLLVPFFRGAGDAYGKLNDIFSAVALLLLIPPAVAVYALARDAAGGWLLAITIAAVAGMLIAGIGQILLVIRVIDLSASFVTGGLGILPILAWVAAVTWLALGGSMLTATVGWLGIAVLASATFVTVAAALKLGVITWVLAGSVLLALVAWQWSLGVALGAG